MANVAEYSRFLTMTTIMITMDYACHSLVWWREMSADLNLRSENFECLLLQSFSTLGIQCVISMLCSLTFFRASIQYRHPAFSLQFCLFTDHRKAHFSSSLYDQHNLHNYRCFQHCSSIFLKEWGFNMYKEVSKR